MFNAETENLIKNWTFPWHIIEVLIGQRSPIDVPRLDIKNREEATMFLKAYGFDPDDETDQRRAHAALIEALNFIENCLLKFEETGPKVSVPKEIQYCEDMRDLILWAASTSDSFAVHRAWACALLRVMHPIAHIEGINRVVDIDSARDQVMGRFRSYLHSDSKGNLWLGAGDENVELEKIDWKYEKTRHSMILKLLHKPGNVTDTVYDQIGIRIVTKRLCDVLLVAKYLSQYYIVSYTNCLSARSRNNLLDFPRFKTNIEMLVNMVKEGKLQAEEFALLAERMTVRSGTSDLQLNNPHSSVYYRAIQLTCRQLIKCQSPLAKCLDKLSAIAKDAKLSQASKKAISETINLISGWPGIAETLLPAAFFPFEVQILDKEAYELNKTGDAAHELYKLSQIRTARRRVLSEVFKL